MTKLNLALVRILFIASTLGWMTATLSQANEFAIDPDVLADLADRSRATEDAAEPADKFTECVDAYQPLIQKLNELQNFSAANPDIVFPPDLKMQLSQRFHKCVKLTEDVLSETRSYIKKLPNADACQAKLAEVSDDYRALLEELGKFKSEPLTTKESRADAFGLATALQLTIPLVHGRAALNRHMLCELSAISN